MAEAALKQRATAAAVLSMNIRELKKYKDAQVASIRLLKQKLTRVTQAKDDLLKKHYLYAEKSGLEPDAAELVEWITT